MLKNTQQRYGSLAIALHWILAAAVIFMFALGVYMTGLGYYHPWYHQAPAVHKSLGIFIIGGMMLRVIWRWINPGPLPEPTLKCWEIWASRVVHVMLYIMAFAVLFSGYLIPTAGGKPIEVFGWFSVPAVSSGIERQADVAGTIHLWAAWGLIGLTAIHAAAALKHHFYDRDHTLKRMLGVNRDKQSNR